MDPVVLILTALSAGAGLGLKDAASSAVMDACNSLKGLVRRKLVSRPDGDLVLTRHERDPQVWRKPLAQELAAVGAGDDSDLVLAAQAVMQLVDATGSAAGKYSVVSASEHAVGAGRDVNVTASGGGTAAGVIHGDMAPPGPTPPGSAQE